MTSRKLAKWVVLALISFMMLDSILMQRYRDPCPFVFGYAYRCVKPKNCINPHGIFYCGPNGIGICCPVISRHSTPNCGIRHPQMVGLISNSSEGQNFHSSRQFIRQLDEEGNTSDDINISPTFDISSEDQVLTKETTTVITDVSQKSVSEEVSKIPSTLASTDSSTSPSSDSKINYNAKISESDTEPTVSGSDTKPTVSGSDTSMIGTKSLKRNFEKLKSKTASNDGNKQDLTSTLSATKKFPEKYSARKLSSSYHANHNSSSSQSDTEMTDITTLSNSDATKITDSTTISESDTKPLVSGYDISLTDKTTVSESDTSLNSIQTLSVSEETKLTDTTEVSSSHTFITDNTKISRSDTQTTVSEGDISLINITTVSGSAESKRTDSKSIAESTDNMSGFTTFSGSDNSITDTITVSGIDSTVTGIPPVTISDATKVTDTTEVSKSDTKIIDEMKISGSYTQKAVSGIGRKFHEVSSTINKITVSTAISGTDGTTLDSKSDSTEPTDNTEVSSSLTDNTLVLGGSDTETDSKDVSGSTDNMSDITIFSVSDISMTDKLTVSGVDSTIMPVSRSDVTKVTDTTEISRSDTKIIDETEISGSYTQKKVSGIGNKFQEVTSSSNKIIVSTTASESDTSMTRITTVSGIDASISDLTTRSGSDTITNGISPISESDKSMIDTTTASGMYPSERTDTPTVSGSDTSMTDSTSYSRSDAIDGTDTSEISNINTKIIESTTISGSNTKITVSGSDISTSGIITVPESDTMERSKGFSVSGTETTHGATPSGSDTSITDIIINSGSDTKSTHAATVSKSITHVNNITTFQASKTKSTHMTSSQKSTKTTLSDQEFQHANIASDSIEIDTESTSHDSASQKEEVNEGAENNDISIYDFSGFTDELYTESDHELLTEDKEFKVEEDVHENAYQYEYSVNIDTESPQHEPPLHDPGFQEENVMNENTGIDKEDPANDFEFRNEHNANDKILYPTIDKNEFSGTHHNVNNSDTELNFNPELLRFLDEYQDPVEGANSDPNIAATSNKRRKRSSKTSLKYFKNPTDRLLKYISQRVLVEIHTILNDLSKKHSQKILYFHKLDEDTHFSKYIREKLTQFIASENNKESEIQKLVLITAWTIVDSFLRNKLTKFGCRNHSEEIIYIHLKDSVICPHSLSKFINEVVTKINFNFNWTRERENIVPKRMRTKRQFDHKSDGINWKDKYHHTRNYLLRVMDKILNDESSSITDVNDYQQTKDDSKQASTRNTASSFVSNDDVLNHISQNEIILTDWKHSGFVRATSNLQKLPTKFANAYQKEKILNCLKKHNKSYFDKCMNGTDIVFKKALSSNHYQTAAEDLNLLVTEINEGYQFITSSSTKGLLEDSIKENIVQKKYETELRKESYNNYEVNSPLPDNNQKYPNGRVRLNSITSQTGKENGNGMFRVLRQAGDTLSNSPQLVQKPNSARIVQDRPRARNRKIINLKIIYNKVYHHYEPMLENPFKDLPLPFSQGIPPAHKYNFFGRNNDSEPVLNFRGWDFDDSKESESHEKNATGENGTKDKSRKSNPQFIVGGRNEHQPWPWIAAIYLMPDVKFICAGTLIDKQHILSAAHCFQRTKYKDASKLTVVIGHLRRVDKSDDYEMEDVVYHQVSKMFVHEEFTFTCFCSDIAILRLLFPLGPGFTPACMNDMEPSGVGETATALGWGDLEYVPKGSNASRGSYFLQRVDDLIIYPGDECSKIMSKVAKKPMPPAFSEYYICAGVPDGSKDACVVVPPDIPDKDWLIEYLGTISFSNAEQGLPTPSTSYAETGDSGGPLMFEDYDGFWSVIGVVSFGYKCASPGIPGTYSKISYFMPWISKVLLSR